MTVFFTIVGTIITLICLAIIVLFRSLSAKRKKWQKKADPHLKDHQSYLDAIKAVDPAEKKQVPNVIVILMDDMGWGDISHFGSKAINTPNIDRLAKKGASMMNGYSSSPVCSPSRFGLLTGRYPFRGMINGVFFPSINPNKTEVFDMEYDDDGIISGKPPGKNPLKPWMFYPLARRSMNVDGILPDEITIAEALKSRGYRTGMFGKWHLGDKSPYLPNDKGFEYFYGAHYSNDMAPYKLWRNSEIAEDGIIDQNRLTSKLTDEIVNFIDKSEDDPFFVYYPSPWPHHPLSAGEDFQGKSKGGLYGDCIQEVDWSVGQIIKKLEDTGKLDNTLILFTSDNGPWHQGSPGMHRGRKGNSFDGGQIVPMLAHYPKAIPEGLVTNEHVMNIDFLPTIMGLAGIELPKDRVIDGRDIMPLLKKETEKSPHDELYYIYNMAAHGIRTQDHFKYFATQKSENSTYKQMKIHPFLFNLNIDQNESYDQRKHFPDKTKVLRDRLYNFNCEIQENPRGWR
ncbi:MAG: sulfatase-like hydrolase/transferase [Spirochaetaceae bacterium]